MRSLLFIGFCFLNLSSVANIYDTSAVYTQTYYITGQVRNGKNEPLSNKEVILKQGKLFKFLKTDKNGNYKVEVWFSITLGQKGSHIFAEDLKWNGTDIEIFSENETAIIPPIWKKHYYQFRGQEIKRFIEKVNIKLTKNTHVNFKEVFEWMSIIGEYKGRIDEICENSNYSDSINSTKADSINLGRIGYNIEILSRHVELINRSIGDLNGWSGWNVCGKYFPIKKIDNNHYKIVYPRLIAEPDSIQFILTTDGKDKIINSGRKFLE